MNDTTELAVRAVTPEEEKLVLKTVANGATEDELKLFLSDCRRQGVHPLDRLIYFMVRKDRQGNRRYAPVTSIDFMRIRAAESGEYAGSDDAKFGTETNGYPLWACVTVWRLVQGQRCSFTATARWAEYKPPEDMMWKKMPHAMLAKCAEALALRKGFPRQLAGLYVKEEMDQAGPPIEEVDSDAEPAKPAKTNGSAKASTAVSDRLTAAATKFDAALAAAGAATDGDECVEQRNKCVGILSFAATPKGLPAQALRILQRHATEALIANLGKSHEAPEIARELNALSLITPDDWLAISAAMDSDLQQETAR